MNLVDKIIGYVNPKAAFERARYRTAMDILDSYADKQRGYEGASKGRRTDGWKATGTSANAEIGPALHTLRNRSRDLVRNNPYARRISRVMPNNIIGTGIRPTPVKDSPSAAKRFKQAWKDWAETTACDFDDMHNLYGLQKIAMRAVVDSGEVVILRRRNPEKSVPIELQVLEGDFIDTEKNGVPGQEQGSYCIQGVEFNKKGKRIAYWIFESHPGEQFQFIQRYKSRRIPAEDVLHIYAVERPGQVRGVPLIIASMVRLKDFDEYEDAQLVRQKIAACFSVFVMDQQDSVMKGDQKAVDMAERVEPGIIEHLPPGKDVKFATPPGADGYADYTRKVQQGIAAGSGISYEAMTGDLSGVNFSSGRMGWIEMQREIEDWQWNTFIPRFCEGTYKWFIDAAVMAGVLRSNVSVSWTTPRRVMLDPVKETNAKVSQISSGLLSLTEALLEDGYDFDEVIQQIAAEQNKIKELGVVLSINPPPSPQQVEQV